MIEASERSQAYEHSDASPRLVGMLAAGLAALLVATPVVLRLAYFIPPPPVANLPEPPAPRLQTQPPADLQKFRADEEARLSTYGWMDRTSGIVRLPIDRAMTLTSERGLPGWQKP